MPLKPASWARENHCWIWTEYERFYFSYCRLCFGSMHIVFSEKLVRPLTKLCLRGTVALRAKAHQKYAIAISAENRHQSTYGIIRQDTVHLHALAVGYNVDFVSPIFKSILSCLSSNPLSQSSCECPMRIPDRKSVV